MISASFLLYAASLLAPAVPPAEIVVSRDRGDDANAGTAEAPLATVTRGVRAARERGVSLVRIEHGEYAAGEAYPLELPPGLELRGIGAGGTILRADSGVLVRLGAADAPGLRGAAMLSGMTLAGAEVGIDAAAPDGGPPVELRLRGVTLAGCGVGVRARPGPLAVTGLGLRALACEVGLDVEGTEAFALRLADSSFEDCSWGVRLSAALGAELADYAGPPVEHDLVLERCAFVGCTQAGIERRGAAGANAGPAYRFEDCDFRGNQVGIELQRPAADTPIDVRGSRFHGNAGFGIRVSGQSGDPRAVSSIADCDFRWNGVGLHATNSHVVYEVRRSRFVDNVGNALFLANFMTAPVTVRIESALIAGNGGAGVHTMADGERLACEVLYSTIVENGAAGVQRQTRHSGESTLEVRGCIVAGNAPDLVRVGPEEVFASLVGDGSAGSDQGNLVGDPGFADAGMRDYALAPDSRCIDHGAADPRLGAGDLAGNPRSGAPDLGALERVP